MDPSPRFQLFVGIDIAAATFTAAWGLRDQPTTTPQQFDQTDAGFAAFQRVVQRVAPPAATIIVLEATSTYWIRLAVTLHQAGYTIAVVNPKLLHNYAKSLPRRSKTDALDAQVAVRFAMERPLPAWTPPPDSYHELRQRLMARDALLEMRQQARNQSHALRQWPVLIASVEERFAEVLATLDEQLAVLDQEIAACLRTGDWAASATLLLTIPGIGIQCAAWLLVTTLNFSLSTSPEALTAYAGLSPLQHESGTSVRGRAHIGRGGNGRLRKALYMATLAAARYNPTIRALYTRLRDRGKAMKVARCAAARKLIHLAWAVVKHGRPFDPAFQHHGHATSEQPA